MEMILLPLAILFLAAPVIAIVALVLARRADRRVRSLERRLDDLGATRPAPPPPAPRPAPLRAEPPPPPPPPGTAAPLPGPSAVSPPIRQEPRPGLEIMIGTRWLNVAGIVTLLFAAAFFLKYAYENAWIGPRGRVAIGMIAGLAALAVGERSRRGGHAIFSQGLTAGGIACLYLSFFFSFRLYSLLEAATAFGLMILVVAGGVALALLHDSLAVALLSFLGAYLTPFLLSTGKDAAGFLFTYLTLLAAAALSVTWFRKWRSLELLAFFGTFVTYAAWHQAHYVRDRLSVAVAGLAVFFVIFLLVPYGHALARHRPTGPAEHAMALGDAAVTFGYLYYMVRPISERAVGFIALGLSACFLALGALARRRTPGDRGLTVSVLGISVAFLTLAIPLQLGLHGVTLAWAAQGLVLVHMGFRYRAALTRLAGLAVLLLAVGRLFVFLEPIHRQPFTLFWNAPFGTWLCVGLGVLGTARLYRGGRERLGAREKSLPSAIPIAGALLILVALHQEIDLFFRLHDLSGDHRAAWLMLLWVVFPLVVLGAGRRLADLTIARAALVLAFVGLFPFLGLLGRVMREPDRLFGSFVFWMGGACAGLFFWLAAWQRRHAGFARPEASLHRLLGAVGSVLLFVLLTAEVHSHFRLEPGTAERMAANDLRASLAVSVLWAVFATVVMAGGFTRADKGYRVAATGLFGITLLKAFVMDVWELEAIYRIISFLVLGLLLVVASFLYSRFRARLAAALLLIGAGVLTPADARADFEPADWRYSAPIEAAGVEGEFGWFVLGRNVLELSRPDLADLRISDRGRREVPYIVRVQRGGERIETYEPRLLNRTRGADGSVSVEISLGGRHVTNLLEIETTGAGFRRRVEIESLDGDGRWRGLDGEFWIYRLGSGANGDRVDRSRIAVPDSDAERLRVTVRPMPGEREPLQLAGVRAFRRSVTAAQTEPLPGIVWKVERDPDARSTRVEIDVGYRNAHPFLLDLDFAEDSFRRPYRLFGRNGERETRVTGRTETGDPIEREVEVPWRELGSGSLFSLPAGRRSGTAIDETSIRLDGSPSRFLRVEIVDRDDPPLRPTRIVARALTRRLVIGLRPGARYTLFTGREDATAPHYDMEALLPDLERSPPSPIAVGAVTPNPLFVAGPPAPWSERYGWVLWVVLIGAVAALALLVRRSARAAPSQGL